MTNVVLMMFLKSLYSGVSLKRENYSFRVLRFRFNVAEIMSQDKYMKKYVNANIC